MFVPAALTKASIRPNRSSAAALAASAARASLMSPGQASRRGCASGAACVIVSDNASARRPIRTTAQPCAASSNVHARPTPEPAPVTIATRMCSLPMGPVERVIDVRGSALGLAEDRGDAHADPANRTGVFDPPHQLVDDLADECREVDVDHGRVLFEVVVNDRVVVAQDRLDVGAVGDPDPAQGAEEGAGEMVHGQVDAGDAWLVRLEAPHERFDL